MEKKFNNILTVILVLAIIATIILAGFWIYDTYTKNKVDSDAEKAIEEFNNQIKLNKEDNTQIEENVVEEPVNETVESNNSSNSGSYNKYKNFTILGYIEIPKTKVNYPILKEITPKALNTAVSMLYGEGINQVRKHSNYRT